MIKNLAVSAVFCVVVACAQTVSSSGNSLGQSSAPITIEVFSDYQCPACKALHEQTLRPVISDYVDKGKVYLRHYEFPLPTHQYAREAACYACAAGRIGKYELAADALFSQQAAWSKDGRIGEVIASVLSPADAKKVQALARSPEIAAEIDRDIERGRRANVRQTPTMVLLHRQRTYPVAGVVSYSILRRFLDQLLNQ